MFDIGFSEILVIAVVALVVIGPEKLPKTARTLGVLFGRLQRYVGEVKADISREMELDELRKLQQEMKSAASDLKESVQSAAHSVEAGARDVEAQLSNTGGDTTGASASGETASAAPAQIATAEVAGAGAVDTEPVRQRALPGFDKI
jgi:sec-independent protein translocase protein TatB